jgi:hypothetical protein
MPFIILSLTSFPSQPLKAKPKAVRRSRKGFYRLTVYTASHRVKESQRLAGYKRCDRGFTVDSLSGAHLPPVNHLPRIYKNKDSILQESCGF